MLSNRIFDNSHLMLDLSQQKDVNALDSGGAQRVRSRSCQFTRLGCTEQHRPNAAPTMSSRRTHLHWMRSSTQEQDSEKHLHQPLKCCS